MLIDEVEAAKVQVSAAGSLNLIERFILCTTCCFDIRDEMRLAFVETEADFNQQTKSGNRVMGKKENLLL